MTPQLMLECANFAIAIMVAEACGVEEIMTQMYIELISSHLVGMGI